MLTLLLLAAAVIFVIRRRERRMILIVKRLRAAGQRSHEPAVAATPIAGSLPAVLASPPKPFKGSPSLEEVAFDYERAVLELRDVSAETKNRAIFLVGRVILPLLGRSRLADVTAEFEQGMEEVLAEYLSDPDAAVYVWRDLLRWARANALRLPPRRQVPARRTGLDADFDL